MGEETTPGRTIISRRDAERHRVRGENAAGPCAFDVVACTPSSSRSANKRVSPRVSPRQGSTTTIRPIEEVIVHPVATGDPSLPPRGKKVFFEFGRGRGKRGEGRGRPSRRRSTVCRRTRRGYVEGRRGGGGSEKGKDARTDEWRSRVDNDAC